MQYDHTWSRVQGYTRAALMLIFWLWFAYVVTVNPLDFLYLGC